MFRAPRSLKLPVCSRNSFFKYKSMPVVFDMCDGCKNAQMTMRRLKRRLSIRTYRTRRLFHAILDAIGCSSNFFETENNGLLWITPFIVQIFIIDGQIRQTREQKRRSELAIEERRSLEFTRAVLSDVEGPIGVLAIHPQIAIAHRASSFSLETAFYQNESINTYA